MGQTESNDKKIKKPIVDVIPSGPKKPTPEIFLRIVYLERIFVFYGGEIYDALRLASISSPFREAVQSYSNGMWMNICANIRKEPGFQQVVRDIAKKNATLLHWGSDCCFKQRELESKMENEKKEETG